MTDQIWTVATLQAHLNTRIDELDRRLTGQIQNEAEKARMNLRAAEEAISKAEKATELRFTSVNEFRATLSDQANTLIPRAEVLAYFQRLTDQMNNVQSRLDRIEGTKANAAGWWEYIFGAVATAAAIMSAIGLAR